MHGIWWEERGDTVICEPYCPVCYSKGKLGAMQAYHQIPEFSVATSKT